MGLCGCHDDLEDISNVEFSTLSKKQAQQCMIGTWRVLQQCGGFVGCVDVKDSFEEYSRDKVVYHHPDPSDSRELRIREWKKEKRGYRLIYDDRESYTLLQFIQNDTLYMTNGREDSAVFSWTAVRVK